MDSGIYALASLDGSPLDPLHLAALGLGRPASPGEHRLLLPGFAVRLADPDPAALSLLHTARTVVAFAGYLDEPEQVVAETGLRPNSSFAVLANGAFEHFGDETPNHLLGEWALLRWQTNPRQLTLLSSCARRDRTYLLPGGKLVAVAPDPMLLGRLSPEGLALDPVGFALNLGRASLRSQLQSQFPSSFHGLTNWKHVHLLQPGACERFTPAQRASARCSPPAVPARFRSTFAEAVSLLDEVGRRVMRQHLGRHPRTAFLLSGGQDSTLLAAWGALERGADASASIALTSVAPPGSALADEAGFSMAAAAQLALHWIPVWPGGQDDVYRPDAALFAAQAGPLVGTRAYVYSALRRAALAAGSTALIDGAWGEEGVTGGLELAPGRSLPGLLDALRRWKHRDRPPCDPDRHGSASLAEAFHVRLSPQLLRALPPAWEADWQKKRPRVAEDSEGRIGFSPVMLRSAAQSTGEPGGLRRCFPFRDRRLAAAVAALPRSFLRHGGVTRALSRALLHGRVPEQVRLRTVKLPFAPDFRARAQGQALAARARITQYRAAGLAEWLDLDWLDGALVRLSRKPDLPYRQLYLTQQTAITAEFLLWVRQQH